MIVADSAVLIDFLEGRGPAANRVALELDRGQLRTTVITRFELLAGAKTARELKLASSSPPCRVFHSTSRVPMPRPRSVEPWNGTAWALAWPTASSRGSWWLTTVSS
jgi:hypothetical protein